MQKFLVLLIIFFYTTTLFAAYDVKIGVYKNAKNLRANIAKIKSTKYRKSIVIEKKNHLYYAHAILPSNKDARNALHAYKRVFDDAFIAKKQVYIKKKISPIVKNKNKNKKQKKLLPSQHKQEKAKNNEIINAQTLLENKTIYLCYEKGPKHLENRVVEMAFEKEYVTYNPLKKMSSPVKMSYEFKENTLILHLSDMKIIHNVYKQASGFLYAKSIIDGMEVNRLRYYFDKDAALAFVSQIKTQHLDQTQN